MKGLYIHIPFCKHICHYCDFNKRVLINKNQLENYIDLIINEMETYKSFLNEDIISIYIGGGTPNIIDPKNLIKLLSTIKQYNMSPIEYTIEINPELLNIDQVKIFKEYGINRISIGAQSFNDEHLQFLGRHHTKKDIINSIHLLRENGITNISLDLIFGYPIDSIDNIKNNIKLIKDLKIEHVSYYNLILEEKTKFFLDYIKHKFIPLDDDIQADMYELINNEFNKNEYHQYEISSYTTNKESIHNKLYWQNQEYIGIGAGASGYLNKVRYDNNSLIKDYEISYIKEKKELSLLEIKKEFMMLGLRMMKGVSISEYKTRYKSELLTDFNLKKLLDEGLIVIDTDYIHLTKRGILLGNLVFEEFI